MIDEVAKDESHPLASLMKCDDEYVPELTVE
jgi:hypothetical protein